jgi:hypothetical protein
MKRVLSVVGFLAALAATFGSTAMAEDVTLMARPATSFTPLDGRALVIYHAVTDYPPTNVKAVSWFIYIKDKQDFDLKKGFVTKRIGSAEDKAKALVPSERFRALAVVPGAYALQSIILEKDGKPQRIHAKKSTRKILLEAGRAYYFDDVIFKWQMKKGDNPPDKKKIIVELSKWLQGNKQYKIDKLINTVPEIVKIERK